MDSLQMLDKLARQMEREKRLHPPAPPAEPKELWPVYFLDPLRPRLSPVAYLVWNCLLLRADPESRIASATFREIKHLTGLRSNQSLQKAIAELARLGYIVPSTLPTGHCQPRTYKIPKHITPTCFAHPEVERLRREADRPRLRRPQPAWLQHLAAPSEPSSVHSAPCPATREPSTVIQEAPKTSLPDLPPVAHPELPALNLEEKVAQATKEVDLILNLLSQQKRREA